MIFQPLKLKGAYLIDLQKREDTRGFFARYYCAEEFANHGLNTQWLQMNNSLSKKKGTLRGLHFQYPPHAEIKLIRCIRGAIWDVIVDIRKKSTTYGKWFGIELNEENRSMIYVPKGFAHGFQSLCDEAELFYMHSERYAPNADGGINPLDPELDIAWPLDISEISERDLKHPNVSEIFNGIEP